MSRKKCFLQVRISHALRFISICDLFENSSTYIKKITTGDYVCYSWESAFNVRLERNITGPEEFNSTKIYITNYETSYILLKWVYADFF
jgi:hypothetical protein